MDREYIKNRIGKTLENEAFISDLSATYYQYADVEGAHAKIQARGRELAARYKACAAGFQSIFSLTTDLKPRNGQLGRELVTPQIVLGHRNDETLGSGKIAALLTARRYDMYGATSSINTRVQFVPDNTPENPIHIASEDFGADGHTFRGSPAFLEDDYDWVGRSDRDDAGTMGEAYHLMVSWSELTPNITSAEETQALLWEALRDPALNPQFAEKAQALQQA